MRIRTIPERIETEDTINGYTIKLTTTISSFDKNTIDVMWARIKDTYKDGLIVEAEDGPITDLPNVQIHQTL